jgi:hypothetical protein
MTPRRPGSQQHRSVAQESVATASTSTSNSSRTMSCGCLGIRVPPLVRPTPRKLIPAGRSGWGFARLRAEIGPRKRRPASGLVLLPHYDPQLGEFIGPGREPHGSERRSFPVAFASMNSGVPVAPTTTRSAFFDERQSPPGQRQSGDSVPAGSS